MKAVVDELFSLILRWGVGSMLDAPCGEFNWMGDVDMRDVSYRGVDIVPDVIERNRRAFGPSFAVADITAHPLPPVDLIVCRDALVHLTLAQGLAALANFRRSGSRYLLATTFAETIENTDIAPGWWRPLNLERQPFNLAEPLDYIGDSDSDDFYSDKILALWRVSDIPVVSWETPA